MSGILVYSELESTALCLLTRGRELAAGLGKPLALALLGEGAVDQAAASFAHGASQAYVGNDSGVSHLAAALGVPTVAVFGPTDPNVWAPRGPSVHTVRGSAPCAPCNPRERRACARSRCLEAISTYGVVDVLWNVLSAA